MALDKGCFIRRAGFQNGVAQLDLKAQDGTFDWSWFFSDAESARAILAVALAAMTSGKNVECTVDDPSEAGSAHRITAIFLLA